MMPTPLVVLALTGLWSGAEPRAVAPVIDGFLTGNGPSPPFFDAFSTQNCNLANYRYKLKKFFSLRAYPTNYSLYDKIFILGISKILV